MRKFILAVILIIIASLAVFVFGWGRDIFAGQTITPASPAGGPTPTQSTTVSPTPAQREIELYLPAAGDKTVGTKFVIYGKGRAFESTINYTISDKDGKTLMSGPMITNAPDAGMFGYFYKEINLAGLNPLPSDIILEVLEFSAKDGSKLNVNTRELSIDKNSTAVFAYFGNNNLDPEISCNKTFTVARLIPKTQSVLKVAIEELLKGPTSSEEKLGFGTLINPGVTINSVKISGDTATIDFSKRIEENAGGSCRVSAIRNQITNTAEQFSNIKKVIISVEGRTEDALQP